MGNNLKPHSASSQVRTIYWLLIEDTLTNSNALMSLKTNKTKKKKRKRKRKGKVECSSNYFSTTKRYTVAHLQSPSATRPPTCVAQLSPPAPLFLGVLNVPLWLPLSSWAELEFLTSPATYRCGSWHSTQQLERLDATWKHGVVNSPRGTVSPMEDGREMGR